MNKPLKQVVKNKMAGYQLPPEQLARLENKIASQHVTRRAKTNRPYRLAGLMAGIFAIALYLGTLVPNQQLIVSADMAQQIANEVVNNHLHLKPLDVQTRTLEGLNQYFTRLNFQLLPSRQIARLETNLLGGRYCSLQSITAAQLRLNNRQSGKTDTLYQTEYRSEVFGDLPDLDKNQSPLEAWAKGIKVRIWVEKGILFAATDVAASRD